MPRSASPKIITRPAGGKSSPAAALSSVDLPQPDGPTMATKVPSSMAKEISRATVWISPDGARKRTVTSSKATAGTAIVPPPSRAGPATWLGLDAELDVRLLDELVGIGGLDVDLGVLDLGHEFTEHGEHGVAALGIHQTALPADPHHAL